MADLPDLLASIRENAADQERWFGLSRWLWDDGRSDEAVVVRCFWTTLRDTVANSLTPESVLDDVARSVRILPPIARKIEECRDTGG